MPAIAGPGPTVSCWTAPRPTARRVRASTGARRRRSARAYPRRAGRPACADRPRGTRPFIPRCLRTYAPLSSSITRCLPCAATLVTVRPAMSRTRPWVVTRSSVLPTRRGASVAAMRWMVSPSGMATGRKNANTRTGVGRTRTRALTAMEGLVSRETAYGRIGQDAPAQHSATCAPQPTAVEATARRDPHRLPRALAWGRAWGRSPLAKLAICKHASSRRDGLSRVTRRRRSRRRHRAQPRGLRDPLRSRGRRARSRPGLALPRGDYLWYSVACWRELPTMLAEVQPVL